VSNSEFDLIERAFRRGAPPVHAQTVVANGDDASVHRLADGMELVVSVDGSMAGVHWPHDFPLDLAADRAACAALSDLAAMGAEPLWLWTTAMAVSSASAEAMGEGINAALHRHGVELAGGDSVRSPVDGLSFTVAGQLPMGTAMRRDAALAGDELWLIGRLGISARALTDWQRGMRDEQTQADFAAVIPQLAAGQQLRQLGVRCCIDVSDGLMQDAGHIAQASGVALHIELERLPGWQTMARELGEEAASRLMLAGGEDYALLFAASSALRGSLAPMAVCIGVCSDGSGVQVQHGGVAISMGQGGYDHFATLGD